MSGISTITGVLVPSLPALISNLVPRPNSLGNRRSSHHIDAANNILVDQEAPLDPPVTATRIGATIESVVLPVVTPAATPAS